MTAVCSTTIDIAGILKRETADYFLVDAGIGEYVWLPKSQVEHDANKNTFAMPEWMAKKKELI